MPGLRKPCKGCGSVTRKVTPPGPRCATCHRDRKKAARKAAHEAYVLRVYGLKAGQYDELYERQGGLCFICRRANGKTKNLAVDHDHASGFVRGLCCGPCNSALAHFRDDPEAFARGAFYLRHPPAFRWIGKVKPDESD